MSERPEIHWREPFRAKVRHSLASFRMIGLLKPTFWIWITLLPAFAAGLLIGAMLWLHPGAQVPWRPVLLIVFGAPAYLALTVAVTVLAPRFIWVRTCQISISSGQSNTNIAPPQLVGITIATDATPAVLRITYMTQKVWRRPSRERTVEIAISPRVDLDRLIDVLTQFRAAAISPEAQPPPTHSPATASPATM